MFYASYFSIALALWTAGFPGRSVSEPLTGEAAGIPLRLAGPRRSRTGVVPASLRSRFSDNVPAAVDICPCGELDLDLLLYLPNRPRGNAGIFG
jgi:hypothetical protein